MDLSSGLTRRLSGYALAISILYLAFGMIEIIVGIGVGIVAIPSLTVGEISNVFSGFVMLIIGVTFFKAVEKLWSFFEEGKTGMAFLYVGSLLAAAFGGIYLALMGANWIEFFILQSEDFIGWTFLNDFRPEIWLFLITLPALIYLRSKIRQM